MVTVSGSASLQRTGAFTFPVARFVLEDGSPDGRVLATLGRVGWFRIFFGPGRRVDVAGGESWRIAATEEGPYIVPVVICDRGKLAAGSPQGDRTYVVHGRDYAHNFYPAPNPESRASTWILREHERVLATFGTRTMHAAHPVPLAAALICFTLIKYGVPGDADLGIPEFRWA